MKEDEKKALVIYHRKDLDGFCSGYLVHAFLRQEGYSVRMRGYDYDDSPSLIEFFEKEWDEIYMVDVTMKDVNAMVGIASKLIEDHGTKFVVIDHHVGFYDKVRRMDYGFDYIYAPNMAACELVYLYFDKINKIPDLIHAIACWDIHRKEGFRTTDGVHVFNDYVKMNIGLDQYLKDPCVEENRSAWKTELQKPLREIRNRSMNAFRWVEGLIKRAAEEIEENSFLATVGKNNMIFRCFNVGSAKCMSKVMKYVQERYYPHCFFWVEPERVVYSLRKGGTEENILKVAVEFGGGGHDAACGFSTTNLELNKL